MNLRRTILAFVGVLLAGLLAREMLEAAKLTPRPIYKSPLGLAIDPTSQFAYVVLQTADALAVVDLKNNKVLAEIPVCKKPYDVALHNGTAYVTCEADDTLVAVDVAERKVPRRFKVGQAPRGVAVDPQTGFIKVVCHDARELWTLSPTGYATQEPLPPQPEGNFARASNLELTLGGEPGYALVPRPFGLFTQGQSIFDPKPAKQPERTAFNPVFDIDTSRTSMDMVAHTRARWFTSTAQAPEGRIFTNALSFFINTSSQAAVVLLDEPTKGYPDPTDVVVQLPRQVAGKKAIPLPAIGNSAKYSLNGARVFISSGGADTVVVLDLMKAANHFERNRPVVNQMGGFQGNFGFSGGWGGGMMMGGGGRGQLGGNSGNFGGQLGGGRGQLGGNSGMGGNFGGQLGGGMLGFPPHPFPPPRPNFGGFHNGQGQLGQFGGGQIGGFGWGGFTGFATINEDLKASANYTLKRLATQANPRRMVLTPDGKTLVVTNHLADSLTLIDANQLRVLRHIDLGGPKPDEARCGEILFHSAKHTFQQQFSCASCHPGGGSDGLAWDTSKTGTGEHLNSRDLHGVRDTRPFGWKGESDTLANRVKNTMRHVHKHQISDKDADAVAAFLQTLDPYRPLPQKLKDQPAIFHGKTLFYGKAGCTRCHRGPAFTSPSPKAVIADFQGKMTEFDVPSLRGVGRSAPYLHDGRAATLEDIFKQHNPHRRHGKAHELTAVELTDLVAFLKSL